MDAHRRGSEMPCAVPGEALGRANEPTASATAARCKTRAGRRLRVFAFAKEIRFFFFFFWLPKTTTHVGLFHESGETQAFKEPGDLVRPRASCDTETQAHSGLDSTWAELSTSLSFSFLTKKKKKKWMMAKITTTQGF